MGKEGAQSLGMSEAPASDANLQAVSHLRQSLSLGTGPLLQIRELLYTYLRSGKEDELKSAQDHGFLSIVQAPFPA